MCSGILAAACVDESDHLALVNAGDEHPTTGIIYFIPRDADNIGEFNSMTNTFSVVDISSIISSNHKYNGGVLGPTV